MAGIQRRKNRRGYTLMEMLLVQGVVVALIAMGWPALRGSLDKNRLLAAAKQVRVEILKARLDAIETGIPRQLRYLPGEGQFETRVGLAAPEGEKTHGLSQTAQAGFSRTNADNVEHAKESSTEIGCVCSRELAEGMIFAPIESAKVDDDRPAKNQAEAEHDPHGDHWSAPIVFYPNGRASNARVRLNGPRDFYVDVTLRGLTGSVAVGDLQRRTEEVR